MAGSLNRAQIIGNLGADPEIRATTQGKKIANINVATEDSWKDKNTGERKSRTEWHRIVVFNEHLAGVVEKYLKKGSKVFVEGSIQTRKWTDQQGNDKYTTEILLENYGGTLTMLDKLHGEQSVSPSNEAAQPAQELDSDLPF